MLRPGDIYDRVEFDREMRDKLGQAGAELGRARVALGYSLRHLGTAARVGWLWGTRLAARVHPELPFMWLARVLLHCGCDARDPTRCTNAFKELGLQHGWCRCPVCHGGAEVTRCGCVCVCHCESKGGAT